MPDIGERSFHPDAVHHDAAVLNAPPVFTNPFTLGIFAETVLSITTIASSTIFQNITFFGIPGAGTFSFTGTGDGTLMQLDSGIPFISPPAASETFTLTILFQFSETEGGPLMNGTIGVNPEEVFGETGDVALVAIPSQDESQTDPNGALVLITMTNLA